LKKILVFPDIHGRTFWKEPVERYADEADRIVFLGDYLDPYRDEGPVFTPRGIFENLQAIIRLKQEQPEKVILLKGNHDQHYASRYFFNYACGTRCDYDHWVQYHDTFQYHADLFQIVHYEKVADLPYLFSHAGITEYWLRKVNSTLWHLPDDGLTLTDPLVANRINLLDTEDPVEQGLLGVVGQFRSYQGESTGGPMWADIREHDVPIAIEEYGLSQVYQVFGHTRTRTGVFMVSSDRLAMIDTLQPFIIDAARNEKIIPLSEYEQS